MFLVIHGRDAVGRRNAISRRPLGFDA